MPGKELDEKLSERATFYPRMATWNRTFQRPKLSSTPMGKETENRRQMKTLAHETIKVHRSRYPIIASILIPNTVNVRVSRPTEDIHLPS